MKVLHTRQAHVLDKINQFNQLASDADRRLKYDKMLESAFVFFRGTNHIYWHDVSRDWRINLYGGGLKPKFGYKVMHIYTILGHYMTTTIEFTTVWMTLMMPLLLTTNSIYGVRPLA